MARSIKRAGGENRITNMSIASVKGVVTDSIRAGRYSIVLDHIKSPSQSLAAAVKELGGWGSTPIIVLARSAHMEDIGFLLPLFPDRADKYALRNFGRGKALTFANEVARQIDLQAVNEEEF